MTTRQITRKLIDDLGLWSPLHGRSVHLDNAIEVVIQQAIEADRAERTISDIPTPSDEYGKCPGCGGQETLVHCAACAESFVVAMHRTLGELDPKGTQRDRRIAELEEKLSVSFNCPRCQTAIMLQPDAPAQPADDFLAAVHSARAKLADAGVNLNAAEFMAEGAPAQPIISKSMAKRLAIMEEAASERSKSADSGQMRPQTESTTDLGVESIVSQLREIITDQANDEGLWFDADRAPEAYLQRSLRDLHGVVERAIAGLTPKEHCPRRLMGEHQEPHMPCDAGDFSRDAQPATKDAQLVRDAMADPKTTPWEEFKAKRGLDEVENDAAEALILAGVSSKRTGRMVYDAAPPSPAGSAKNATQKEAFVVGDRSEKRSDKEAHDGGNSSNRKTYTLDEIRAAFWTEYHRSGESFFPYPDMGASEEECDQVTGAEWESFVAALDAAREER